MNKERNGSLDCKVCVKAAKKSLHGHPGGAT